MRRVQSKAAQNRQEIQVYRNAPRFVPAGQSTQMIIGATPETDYQIMQVTEALYQKFELKRVFFSAFVLSLIHIYRRAQRTHAFQIEGQEVPMTFFLYDGLCREMGNN